VLRRRCVFNVENNNLRCRIIFLSLRTPGRYLLMYTNVSLVNPTGRHYPLLPLFLSHWSLLCMQTPTCHHNAFLFLVPVSTLTVIDGICARQTLQHINILHFLPKTLVTQYVKNLLLPIQIQPCIQTTAPPIITAAYCKFSLLDMIVNHVYGLVTTAKNWHSYH